MTRDILQGKNARLLRRFPDHYFSAVVSDPPYGWSFMDLDWDQKMPTVQAWRNILRVLKPGGHLLICCGTRTQHHMASNLEKAGAEIRDVIPWHYATGFPKSLNLKKTFDRKGQLAEAAEWDGWGTALKPATEFWTLARKPLATRTMTENICRHGTGPLHIDACRIPFASEQDQADAAYGTGADIRGQRYAGGQYTPDGRTNIPANEKGRWPANVLLDEAMAAVLDAQTGILTSGQPSGIAGKTDRHTYGQFKGGIPVTGYGDSGGGSRFFFVAKPSPAERDAGLPAGAINDQPTVKPTTLLRYLLRLITPPGGMVLDPYAGSGTTGCAAEMEGIPYVLMEKNPKAIAICQARCRHWSLRYLEEKGQLSLFAEDQCNTVVI